MSQRNLQEEARQPEDAAGSSSRRSFLWKIWLALGGLALLEYLWLAADFLRPRSGGAAEDAESIIVAGPVERFSPGSVTAFPAGKFYLARLENGGFLALSRECTHLGCTVPWLEDETRFVCPCHSSAYDMRGDVLSPPAPRALDHYAVRIENGIVKVDVSRRLQRRSFDYDQVVQP
ncbi:MAG: ubiquinol-cytochrome c reductase iron-sulfur subunit [Gemmatimonadales bacterium]|jgi:cytochrome b6-f complex iron-sulfur subunit